MTRLSSQSCDHESEVLDLVAIGQWPERADAALRAHAGACPICADLATAARAIADLRDQTTFSVPDASVVWRRAQVRAREDAARQAGLPVTVAACAAAAALAGVGIAAWQAGGPWLGAVRDRATALVPDLTFAIPRVSVADLAAMPGVPAVAAGLIAAVLVVPVALYLAKLADR